jgi:hypothetical protein
MLMLMSLNAHALVWLSGSAGALVGGSSWEEVDEEANPNINYLHDFGIVGYELSAKAGLNFWALHFGAAAAFSKLTINGIRTEKLGDQYVDQREHKSKADRLLAGGHFGLRIPSTEIRIFAEYYPFVELDISKIEQDLYNPFSTGDKLDGQGFGLGISIEQSILYLDLTFRAIEYKKINQTNGTKINLPDSSFPKKFGGGEVVVHIGLAL